MKNTIFPLLLIFSCNFLSAQTLDWVKHMGAFGFEGCDDHTTDASGNIYTFGFFGGTVDFNIKLLGWLKSHAFRREL